MSPLSPSLKTILVAQDNGQSSSELMPCLSKLGYSVVGTAVSPGDILSLVRSLKPHLLILRFEDNFAEKLDVIREIVLFRTTAIIVLMKEWEASLAKKVMEAGVSGYLLKPLDEAHVSA